MRLVDLKQRMDYGLRGIQQLCWVNKVEDHLTKETVIRKIRPKRVKAKNLGEIRRKLIHRFEVNEVNYQEKWRCVIKSQGKGGSRLEKQLGFILVISWHGEIYEKE